MKQISCMAAVLAMALLLAAPVSAQCSPQFSLGTPVPNNGHAGEMFDMQPSGTTALRIDSFDVLPSVSTPVTYEVWVRPALQSFVGYTGSSAGWTLLGTSAPITGVSPYTTPVPLNLCLNYTLQPGGRTGFYVTIPGGITSNRYTNGTAVGSVWVSDPNLTVYQGQGGGYWAVTIATRCFAGNVRYSYANNVLSLTQSGPGVGDLTVSLGLVSPTSYEGWTLLTTVTSMPLGSGPILGIWPDALSWDIIGYPYFPGSPFHFHSGDAGVFPSVPFAVGPGSVTSLTGLSLDAVCLLLNAAGGFDSRSNVYRILFQ